MATTLAKNTVLKISDMAVSTPALTQITGVTVTKWSGRKTSTEKTTSHDNATPVDSFAPTIYTNGDIQLTIDWDSTNVQHAQLKALSISAAFNDFEMIQVGGAGDDKFSAFVSSFAFDTPVDGLLKANITLTVNGEFTA